MAFFSTIMSLLVLSNLDADLHLVLWVPGVVVLAVPIFLMICSALLSILF